MMLQIKYMFGCFTIILCYILCLYGFINIFVIYFLLLLVLILTTKVIFGHSNHIYQYFSGLGLWSLTPLLTIFQIYSGGQL